MAGHASTQDIEQGFDIALGAGVIDDGERAQSEGRVHLTHSIAGGAAALDDNGRRRRREAGEEVENPGAGFFARGVALIEGEGEIDPVIAAGVGELLASMRAATSSLVCRSGPPHSSTLSNSAVTQARRAQK